MTATQAAVRHRPLRAPHAAPLHSAARLLRLELRRNAMPLPLSAPGPGKASGPVYAAARRFAALSATFRHDWLATHLAALRSGQLTLAQLP